MRVKEIFELCVQTGIENDPRGKDKVEKILAKNQKEYDELPEEKKSEYDIDKLTNPYSDSAMHYGDPEKEVKRVLVGIDIDPAEILLAKELERAGKPVDLIISHHPMGKALALLHEVMDIQTEVLTQAGVPENIAEGVLRERLSEVSRGLAPINHYQTIDMARLLNIPLMNLHTPGDNAVWHFVDKFIQERKPHTLGEITACLKEIPEYKQAAELYAGPTIFAGSEDARAGKIVVSGMTGGTSGSEKVYEKMAQYGIGTEIAMHIREKDRDEANKYYVNVVIAGHIASDSIGLNILMDKLEKAGVEIIPCSGYIRHSRA